MSSEVILHSVLLIAVMALCTALTRFLPFLVFNEKRPTPKIVLYLGKVLPFAIMGMLVVFCMKDTVFTAYPYGIPEVIAILAVVLLHIWKRNTLLSVGIGTVGYMLLVQFVF